MIRIAELTKNFGSASVVDHISFTIEPGEVLGFLGPNGAGKSTTMKMLTGFLEPTSGSITVSGFDVEKQPLQVQKLIGYLPEGAPSYGDMTVLDFLQFIGEVRGFKGIELERRIEDASRKVALQKVLNQRIETLSKGFKRRVGLAQAIIHDPKILVLDEPTDGLDPNQKHQVRELIRNLSRDKIVIISTHILEEVSAVCSRALILSEGKIVFDGTPDALAKQSDYHNAVTVSFKGVQQAVNEFKRLDGVKRVETREDGRCVTLIPESGQVILKQVNHLIHQHDWDVEEFHVEKGQLDDVFRKVTQGNSNGSAEVNEAKTADLEGVA